MTSQEIKSLEDIIDSLKEKQVKNTSDSNKGLFNNTPDLLENANKEFKIYKCGEAAGLSAAIGSLESLLKTIKT